MRTAAARWVTSLAAGVSAVWAMGAVPADAAPSSWEVPQAQVRFTLKLTDRPTHPSAGFFAHLPDGGILPGPHPVPTVVVPGGTSPLESYSLWENKESGFSLVFADPGPGVPEVHVYVAGSNTPRVWNSETGLHPSALLCVQPGKSDLVTAHRLAKPGPVPPSAHVRNKAGIAQAPFSIGGDDTGRPRPASFYLLAHVDVTDPGQTWIAPFVIDGECEVVVDGKKLNPQERIDKWGGTGAYVDLTKGLHRIEVFQTADGTGPYSSDSRKGGLMYLTWRRPNATMDELGGVRSDKVPMAGTSRMETRVLNAQEIVRSGSCALEGAITRSGGPVPCVEARPAQTFWFGNESPLLIYEMRALTAGHPQGSTYQWDLPGGAKVEGSTVRWVFPGLVENKVMLTARAGNEKAQCVQPFFGYGTAATSLSNPEDRAAFRDTLTAMVEAYPTDPDPVASWGRSFWNNLIRTTEQGQGYPLLYNLFTVRLPSVYKNLSPAQAVALQDLFLDMLQQRKPDQAIQIIDKLHESFDEGIRRDSLLIRKAEVYMYYLGDLPAAARGLTVFSDREGDLAEWARIRLGDLAFLGGDLNKATRYYAEVQRKARTRRNQTDQLVTEALLGPPPAPAPENGKEKEPERRIGNPRPLGEKREQPGTKPEEGPGTEELLPGRGANWRIGALRDVSNSENVAKLIEGGFLLEAQQALREWEREFPLSKISGDLLLVEARYHMKVGDWKRARVMLEAYCREIDASSYLPDAARTLIECVTAMKAPRDEVREVIEKVRKRLEFHPVAKELEEFLSSKK